MQTKVTQVEKKLHSIKSRVDSLREKQESLSSDKLRLKEQMKIFSKAHKEQEVLIGKSDNLDLCLCRALFCVLNNSCQLT